MSSMIAVLVASMGTKESNAAFSDPLSYSWGKSQIVLASANLTASVVDSSALATADGMWVANKDGKCSQILKMPISALQRVSSSYSALTKGSSRFAEISACVTSGELRRSTAEMAASRPLSEN